MIIFCDIDGTVADNSHRQGFLQGTKKDWDSFYNPDLVTLDKPIEAAVLDIKKLLHHPRVESFHFLTGRPERLRHATEQWVFKHLGFMPNINGLLMRPDNDFQKADAYKEKSIRKVAGVGYDDILFIDDDERNTEMYRRWGVFLKAPECWGVLR